MNDLQNSIAQNVGKPFPGCLGRMVNLFDLSAGMAGNRLIADKPHNEGISLSRSRSDVARKSSGPLRNRMEDKVIVSESRTVLTPKINGTPMKKLIAQEMSKEVESKHSPPNVVAKLMGLDTVPSYQPNLASQRSHQKGFSRRSLSHSEISVECWDQNHAFINQQVRLNNNRCQEQQEYKDVYEIWEPSQKTSYSRDSSPHKERYTENINEKKMALVRQKFMDAKRMSTDEKLRQSKEFQDTLEVLSSNKDLFLKFLQEPNSLFSQHLSDMQSFPSTPETKRITVLRPSKIVDKEKSTVKGKKDNYPTKSTAKVVQATGWECSNPGYCPRTDQRGEVYPTQPTRIVVLKPSGGKLHDVKAAVPTSTLSPGVLHREDPNEEPRDDEARESRELAKEIAEQMRENLMGHRRDETLLSSVFSNGYIVDDSSFNKSEENEYALGNLSDLEIMSPTSRNSWDYVNRYDSPYSCSSFSRGSCSPESSVCREAKKRLSERWASMASNGIIQEQKHVPKVSSTLGEMLALSDMKKPMGSEEEYKEQESRGSTSCIVSNFNTEGLTDSPKNLLRSKSVPVSSTAYGARLNVEISDHKAGQTQVPKELKKAKSMKSSFKGKVSSLFFSRTKKSCEEKSSPFQSTDEIQSATTETTGYAIPHAKASDHDASLYANDAGFAECSSSGIWGSSTSKRSSSDLARTGQNQDIISQEASLAVEKPPMLNVNENQDQPSPVSVLEPPFDDDENTLPESSANINTDLRGTTMSLKSNLIDKSPPIESMARTLSRNDSCTETATQYYSMKRCSSSSSSEKEEQDWVVLIQTLLSEAGLGHDTQQLDSFQPRWWHSHDSPLDPSLRDRFSNERPQESNRRQQQQHRSNRKLVFDCVNDTLAEIREYGSAAAAAEGGTQSRWWWCVNGPPSTVVVVVERVWGQMKEWVNYGEVKGDDYDYDYDDDDDGGCGGGGGRDRNRLVVERVVRKEVVVGKEWGHNIIKELQILGNEIEEKLLEELVEETLLCFK